MTKRLLFLFPTAAFGSSVFLKFRLRAYSARAIIFNSSDAAFCPTTGYWRDRLTFQSRDFAFHECFVAKPKRDRRHSSAASIFSARAIFLRRARLFSRSAFPTHRDNRRDTFRASNPSSYFRSTASPCSFLVC